MLLSQFSECVAGARKKTVRVQEGTGAVRRTTRFVIVELGCESGWDGEGEDDGSGWMAALKPLRSGLFRGLPVERPLSDFVVSDGRRTIGLVPFLQSRNFH